MAYRGEKNRLPKRVTPRRSMGRSLRYHRGKLAEWSEHCLGVWTGSSSATAGSAGQSCRRRADLSFLGWPCRESRLAWPTRVRRRCRWATPAPQRLAPPWVPRRPRSDFALRASRAKVRTPAPSPSAAAPVGPLPRASPRRGRRRRRRSPSSSWAVARRGQLPTRRFSLLVVIAQLRNRLPWPSGHLRYRCWHQVRVAAPEGGKVRSPKKRRLPHGRRAGATVPRSSSTYGRAPSPRARGLAPYRRVRFSLSGRSAAASAVSSAPLSAFKMETSGGSKAGSAAWAARKRKCPRPCKRSRVPAATKSMATWRGCRANPPPPDCPRLAGSRMSIFRSRQAEVARLSGLGEMWARRRTDSSMRPRSCMIRTILVRIAAAARRGAAAATGARSLAPQAQPPHRLGGRRRRRLCLGVSLRP
mmetsp:Transcript_14351/g.40011  ORF Transcript_14351/g.40011 Transcript_14351/m.40011 type:complete len:416 (-) Transcript_14351:191-1438(-)